MADKNRSADVLFSKVVRMRGQCENCGVSDGLFECAHIVRRRFLRTRWVEDNAWNLCTLCHRMVDTNDRLFSELVEKTIGWPKYDELRALAHSVDTPKPDRSEVRARLRTRLEQLKAVA